MPVTLDERAATNYNIMTGDVPEEFTLDICPNHYSKGHGWTRNPRDESESGDALIWVCGYCHNPSRIALISCWACEYWFIEMRQDRLAVVRYDGTGCPRNDYLCKDCGGD